MAQQLESYIKELKQVFYLTSTMQKYVDLKQLLSLMLEECMSMTNATSGSVMFRHKQSKRLFFYVEKGLNPEVVKQINLNIGDGIAGNVIAEGIPMIINNITLDPKYISMDSNIKAEMAVPIIVDQQVLGVIVLDHTSTDQFTNKHLELVQMISSYTGFVVSHYIQTQIAQKNARLLDNIININSKTSPEEIFQILTNELKASKSCIIDSKGQVVFGDKELVEEIDLGAEAVENSSYEILKTENESHIPYTRIVIPRIKKDMTFIADKIYYFSDNVQTDIDFANKILEFLTLKDSKFLNDESLSQWAERKLQLPEGTVYDVAIGSAEKEVISAALKKFKFNRLKTAQFLGINRNTLRHKMEIFGLDKQ